MPAATSATALEFQRDPLHHFGFQLSQVLLQPVDYGLRALGNYLADHAAQRVQVTVTDRLDCFAVQQVPKRVDYLVRQLP